MTAAAPKPPAALQPSPALPGAEILIWQSQGPRQCKLIRRDGTVEPAEPARRFTAARVLVANLATLGHYLHTLLGHPERFLTRGELTSGAGGLVENIRRLSRPDGADPATVRDVARPWLALDMDDVPLPAGVDVTDLRACGEAAVATLPAEFHGVRVIVQATGSHGIKPGIRLRLFYWLSRSITCREARVWLATAPVDHSIFHPSQPIYTAPPKREDGGPDHLPERLTALAGAEAVQVPPITPPAPREHLTEQAVTIGQDELGAIESILRALPNLASRKQWLALGHAVAEVFGAEIERGQAAWLEWTARRDGPNDPERDLQTWESISAGPHDHGLDLILNMARRAGINPQQHGYEGPGCLAGADEFEATEIAPAGYATPAGRAAQADVTGVLLSEDQLAEAWTRHNPDRFLYVNGDWLERSGHVWLKDEKNAVLNSVRLFGRQVADILRAREESRTAERVASVRTARAMMTFAASDVRHAATLNDFDADPWALNTPGGVVDLRTGAIRAHAPTDRFAKSTTVAPGGDCPRWIDFLHQVTLEDLDYVDYLQRWAGYCATGVIREHALPCLSGPGGNGKGVLIQALSRALGSYAVTSQPDLITESTRDQHPTHLTILKGARLCAISETEENRPWAETRLKQLTGGDQISARLMHKDLIEFSPSAKMLVSTNHRPPLRNVDAAMRRRLHILPFRYRPVSPDLHLEEALRAELSGILAWILDGTAKWISRGLEMPKVVRAATAEYLTDQDTLGAWLAECTKTDPAGRVSVKEAFLSWSGFALSRHESSRTMKWFSPAVCVRGIEKRRSAAGCEFRGIALVEPQASGFPP